MPDAKEAMLLDSCCTLLLMLIKLPLFLGRTVEVTIVVAGTIRPPIKIIKKVVTTSAAYGGLFW